MANIIKAELQDADGNIYYLHTSADVVFLEDGSTLESKLGTLVDETNGDISGTKITTIDTVSADFPVPVAGENTKTFLGKVKKFFSDFIAIKNTLLTISNLVNNGQTTATGLALDARYGKTLYDLYAQLNSNLNTKVTGSLDALANVTFGRASNRVYIRFSVSTTIYYQLEIYDDGPLVFARAVDGAWATMWTK